MITEQMIENAKAEQFICKIRSERGEQFDLLTHALHEFPEHLSVYKMVRHCGHDLIVLYKKTGFIAIADFMTESGIYFQSLNLPESDVWHTHATLAILKEWASQNDIEIYDKRYKKYTVIREAVWNQFWDSPTGRAVLRF